MSKDELEQLVQRLQEQVAALSNRLSLLESEKAVQGTAVQAPTAPQPAPVAEKEEIPEDILLAISAAVAAFLGKRAPVRAVRLISTTRWSQEGRVSIQASHRLERG